MPLLGCLGLILVFGVLGTLVFLVDFFFGSATGPLIAVAQEQPAFWIAVAAALGYVTVRWLKHRNTFGIAEFAAQLGITYLGVLISTTCLLAGSYDVADVWVDTERLYGGLHEEPYTIRGTDGDPYRMDEAYKVRLGDIGFWKFDITAEQYANLKAFCGNETLVADRHEDQLSEGDGRTYGVDCRDRAYPALMLWQAPNYLQASRLSILGSQGRLPEIRDLAERLGLDGTDYPGWTDGPFGRIEFQRFWLLGDTVDPAVRDRVETMLDRLALSSTESGGGFNPMLVVVSAPVDPAAVVDVLTWRWSAPKKTDVILVVNVGDDRRIRWARVLAATDDVGVRAGVEAAVLALGTFDAIAVAETFARDVVDDRDRLGFALKDPEDYAYLTAGFRLPWSDVAIMVAIVLVANWLTTRFFIWFNPVLWVRRLRAGFTGRR